VVNYYNEFDPKAAAWLRELIKAGLIPAGHVDERSILEVEPKDLDGYTQHHFFAGIGGWSYALKLAGWPDDKPVWTASLPCQPFSTAGKGLGKQDERHLLPHFLELVKQCRPDTIFGEQVEGAIRHGWLDDLQATMEAEGYAVGHCVLGAHSVGAAHIRQRLYWVANSISEQREQQQNERSSSVFRTAVQSEECVSRPSDIRSTFDGGMVYANDPGSQQRVETAETARYGDSIESASCIDGMADTFCFKRIKPGNGRGNESIAGAAGRTNSHSSEPESIDWIYCRDNKYRPIKSGIKPLVNGIARGMVYSSDSSAPINPNATQEARVMRLKGYGNAIVPQVAAEFIKAFMEVT
jgi:DNA (cytosine-5)-methyltransferase 1